MEKNLPVPAAMPRSVRRAVPDSKGFPSSGYIEIDTGDADGNELNRWLEYVAILRRRKLALIVAALGGALIGFVISLYQTPTYSATASLEVQSSEGQQPFEGISFMNSGDPYLMQTQVQLLTSRMLQDRVIATLSAKAEGADNEISTPLGSPRVWLGLPSLTPSPAWQEAISMARGSVTVTNLRDTRIVRIASESTLPRAAADYANTLAEVFIQHNQEQRWSLYQATGAWLEKAQEELKTKLEESEKQLLAYSGASGVIVTSKAENMGEQKLFDVQAELSRAQASRIEREAMYRTASSRSVGDMLASDLIGSYELKITDLRRELAELTTSLTEAHPKVQRLKAQVEELRTAQAREQHNIINRLRTEYESALHREQQLQTDFEQQSRVLLDQDQKLIRYKMLQREVETYRGLYDTMLQKGKEASIASALRPVSARVIDIARVPRVPSKPNATANVGVGLGLGLLLGVGLVLVRHNTDASIQAPGSTLLQLNVRELGVIPSAAADHELSLDAGWKTRRLLASRAFKPPATRVIGEPVELASWSRKGSLLAESVRTTLTSILMSGPNGDRPRVLLVTSPAPRDGKSTVVTNLGIALAEIHQRVLLVDADLRRPRLHTIFRLANTWGLSDLLQEEVPVGEYPTEALAHETHIPGLFLLPSGPGGVSVSRLLHSARVTDLFGRLQREFDAVLIDSPPVLSVADSRVLARIVDAVVLVFRAGQTTREAATMAVSVLDADGTPVLGTVLNDWNPRHVSGGYYRSYYTQDYTDRSAG